ncbi:MAG: hypothetical protein J6X70_09365 [Muribaculaceae bacterium]|nr:hypothetical protein [Muribaculaceae bacterium]
MKYTCPRCNCEMELETQELVASGYETVCPKCSAQLKIVGNYAYMPTEETPIGPPPPPGGGEYERPRYVPETGTATLDPLYDDAVRYVATCNAIHVGMLADYFQIEPERAMELMNQLESHGIVGPYEPGRPRRILIPHNEHLPSPIQRTQEMDEAFRAAREAQEAEGGQTRGCTLQLGRGGCFSFFFMLLLLYVLLRMCSSS